MKQTVGIVASVLLASGAVAFAQQNQQQTQTPAQDNNAPGQGASASAPVTASGSGSSQDNLGTKERPIMVVAATTTATGTVTGKNVLLRTLTIKTDDGQTVKMKVGREVPDFDEIKKGDQVKLTYDQETAIALRKGPAAPAATVGHALIVPTKGAPPVAAEITTIESAAVIEDFNPNARTMRLRAPDGSVRTIKVSDEVQNLGDFQKGDQVAVRTTEAVAVAVHNSHK